MSHKDVPRETILLIDNTKILPYSVGIHALNTICHTGQIKPSVSQGRELNHKIHPNLTRSVTWLLYQTLVPPNCHMIETLTYMLTILCVPFTHMYWSSQYNFLPCNSSVITSFIIIINLNNHHHTPSFFQKSGKPKPIPQHMLWVKAYKWKHPCNVNQIVKMDIIYSATCMHWLLLSFYNKWLRNFSHDANSFKTGLPKLI